MKLVTDKPWERVSCSGQKTLLYTSQDQLILNTSALQELNLTRDEVVCSYRWSLQHQLTIFSYLKWTGPFETLGWGFKLGGSGFGLRIGGSGSNWNMTAPVLLKGTDATLAPDSTFIYATCNKTKGEEVYHSMLLYVPPPALR